MRPSEKRYLHHCSIRSEKNQRTGDKFTTLMKKVCCQLSPFFAHTSTGRPVCELSSHQKRKSSREMENERIRILVEIRKEQILAEVRTVIQKHEFQADSDRRSIQELNGTVESQRREIDHTIAGSRDLREAYIKSLYEMEELNRVQELRVDESSRRRLIQNQDTVDELTATIQELRNEVGCMSDLRIFKMLNQYVVDYPTFPVNPRYSHFIAILAGC